MSSLMSCLMTLFKKGKHPVQKSGLRVNVTLEKPSQHPTSTDLNSAKSDDPVSPPHIKPLDDLNRGIDCVGLNSSASSSNKEKGTKNKQVKVTKRKADDGPEFFQECLETINQDAADLAESFENGVKKVAPIINSGIKKGTLKEDLDKEVRKTVKSALKAISAAI